MISAVRSPLDSVLAILRSSVARSRSDNRGAIMVIGIFMACAMVGMMWYMVGIGDALIWRDRSQEAADSIAFSSAAIHAHSMNIIAFLNIVMAILVAIYLLAAIVYNLTDFLLLITGRNDDCGSFWRCLLHLEQNSCDVRDKIKDLIELVLAFFTGGATAEDVANSEFCDAAQILQLIHDPLADDLGSQASGSPMHLIKKYEDYILGPVNYYSAKLQRGIAELGPWAGAVMGSYVGYNYVDRTNGEHRIGTALSPSMMSASKVNGYKISEAQKSIDWLKSDDDVRIGLPVGELRMGYLCYRDFKWLPNLIISKLGIGQIPFIGAVIQKVIDGLATSVEDWYCAPEQSGSGWTMNPKGQGFAQFVIADDTILSGPPGWAIVDFGNPYYDLQLRVPPYSFDYKGHFWKDEKVGGPKVMMEYAQNNNDWMQVWGFVIPFNRAGMANDREVNDAEHRVAIAGAIKDGKWNESHNSRTLYSEIKNIYYASAEFYLDKDKTWTDLDVNDTADSKMYSATFSLKWRTRLRRVHSPAWGGEMLKWIQGGTGLPVSLMTNANFIKAMDFLSNYVWDDPQAKYTTAWKALKDGEKHKAKNYMDADSLVKDALH